MPPPRLSRGFRSSSGSRVSRGVHTLSGVRSSPFKEVSLEESGRVRRDASAIWLKRLQRWEGDSGRPLVGPCASHDDPVERRRLPHLGVPVVRPHAVDLDVRALRVHLQDRTSRSGASSSRPSLEAGRTLRRDERPRGPLGARLSLQDHSRISQRCALGRVRRHGSTRPRGGP